jgi:hypothetical protein
MQFFFKFKLLNLYVYISLFFESQKQKHAVEEQR